jgi:hypothetical protein
VTYTLKDDDDDDDDEVTGKRVVSMLHRDSSNSGSLTRDLLSVNTHYSEDLSETPSVNPVRISIRLPNQRRTTIVFYVPMKAKLRFKNFSQLYIVLC